MMIGPIVGGMVCLFFLSLKIVSMFCLVKTFFSTPQKKSTLSSASSCRDQQSIRMVGHRKGLLEV
jgi:hypothetical protein